MFSSVEVENLQKRNSQVFDGGESLQVSSLLLSGCLT